jgi:hypothetical protein
VQRNAITGATLSFVAVEQLIRNELFGYPKDETGYLNAVINRATQGGELGRPMKILMLCTFLVGALSISCFGDPVQSVQTLTAGGIAFNANLTSDLSTHTYTLIFSGVNTSGSSNATLNTFALQLFGPGANGDFTISTNTPVSNWTFYAGQKINNSGGLGCPTDSNGVAGWLCGTANSSGNAYVLAPSGNFSWTFTGTFANSASPVATFDLMANGLYSGGKWAISAPMSGPSSVPEPASMLMLGLGISLTTFLRRR